MRSEIDNLKRRIERQEVEYLQTMKANTVLKCQIETLKNKASAQQVQPTVHVGVPMAELEQQNLLLENQMTELRAKLDEAVTMMRMQH